VVFGAAFMVMKEIKGSAPTIALLMFLLAVFLFALPGCRRSPTENAPEVVLYCSVDQVFAEQIIPVFERRTGIKVLSRFDTEATKTTGLVQRIRAEAAAPVADVFWSSEIFYTIRLARQALLTTFNSDATRAWPDRFSDPNGRWYGFALRARVIAYNTNKLKPTEAPKRLEELLNPRWEGRLVMADPGFGTTGGDVASWFVHYGKERAIEILKALKKNGIRLVEGNSTAVRMVATGRADICLADTDDVYAAQRNSWPVAMNYLDQGGDGVLAIPNTVALIKDCPHPKQAAHLMEFLLSEEVEEMLARSDSHNAPIHPNVAARFKAYEIPNILDISYEQIADHLSEAIEIAREILQ